MLFLCCLPFSLKFTTTPKIYTFGCKFFDLGKSKGFLNLRLLETQGREVWRQVLKAASAEAQPEASAEGSRSGGKSGRSLRSATSGGSEWELGLLRRGNGNGELGRQLDALQQREQGLCAQLRAHMR